MKISRKIIAIASFAVLLVFGVKEGIRKYPDLKADFLEQKRRMEIYDLSGVEEAEGFHDKIEALNNFVHANSVHNIDSMFWDDFKHKPRTLDKFLAFAKGQSSERPHMECSTRSKLLMPLIHRAGYEAHMVDLFRYDEEYRSHVVVEVKNPENGQWEIYDPTYQIFWRNDKTGERAGIQEMVEEKEFHFTPCHDEKRCGFNREDADWPPGEKLKSYFGYAVRMDDEGSGYRVFNNPNRFDVTKPPQGASKTFCAWGGKRWCPGGKA